MTLISSSRGLSGFGHRSVLFLHHCLLASCLQVDLGPIIREFMQECSKELSFTHEAANLGRAGRNSQVYNRVIIPRVIPGMASERVLVMTWEDGFRVSDVEALAKHEVDTEHQKINRG